MLDPTVKEALEKWTNEIKKNQEGQPLRVDGYKLVSFYLAPAPLGSTVLKDGEVVTIQYDKEINKELKDV
jgi:hypothetical protein